MSGAERWDMCFRPFGAGAGRIDTGPATALHVLDGARPAIPVCTPRARLFLAVTIRRWTRRDTAHVALLYFRTMARLAPTFRRLAHSLACPLRDTAAQTRRPPRFQ